MIRAKSIKSVVYAVDPESLQRWGWFWAKGMEGRFVGENYMAPTNKDWGSVAWMFNFGTFNINVIAGITKGRISPLQEYVERHGDHCVREVFFEVADPTYLLQRSPMLLAEASRRGILFVNPKLEKPGHVRTNSRSSRWVKGVDHIAIAVTPGTIQEEAKFWETLGGKPTKKMDDVMSKDSPSSMMLWCFDFETFGVALIAGLDREKESQVTVFTNRHGAPCVQHVAYGVYNLEAFRAHLVENLGGHMRGEILEREDDFGRGVIRQVFGAGYVEDDPAKVGFPEFVERPDASKSETQSITFSRNFGAGLYQQIENARKAHDTKPLVDFSRMPKNWEPKEVSK